MTARVFLWPVLNWLTYNLCFISKLLWLWSSTIYKMTQLLNSAIWIKCKAYKSYILSFYFITIIFFTRQEQETLKPTLSRVYSRIQVWEWPSLYMFHKPMNEMTLKCVLQQYTVCLHQKTALRLQWVWLFTLIGWALKSFGIL